MTKLGDAGDVARAIMQRQYAVDALPRGELVKVNGDDPSSTGEEAG